MTRAEIVFPPRPRALSTAGLLRSRAVARGGLLASAVATVTVAVATVCTLLAWLIVAVGMAGDAAPPGVPADEVAAQVDRGVLALVSAAPAPVLLVVIVAGTAAAQLARLLAAARGREAENLRARGLSRRQSAGAAAVEAAAVAVAGAGAGLALAVLLLALIEPGGVPAVVSLWWAAAATGALLGLVLTGAARPRPDSPVRGARASSAVAVLLVLSAAAFVLWQLPLARTAGFDLIVAVAPTVVLMAAALLVLAVFGAIAAACAVATARRPGWAPAYAARQIARRLPIYAVAVLLVGLTVAQAVFASAYGATSTAMATDSAALRTGADLRIDLAPDTATPGLVAAAAAVPGVDAAAAALVAQIEIGSSQAQQVAVPETALQTVVSAAGGAVDRAALAASVVPSDGTLAATPLPLGAAATGVRVTVSIETSRQSAADTVMLQAHVLDATGAHASLRLAGQSTPGPDGATLTAGAPLPDGAAPWSLLAVNAVQPATLVRAPVTVRILQAQAIGADALPIDGAAEVSADASEKVLWLATPDGAGAEPGVVRAVLTSALAARMGVQVGDEFEFRYAGAGRRAEFRVADIVPGIPGAATELAVLAPLGVLQVSMLQRGTTLVPASSIWAAGDPSADVALSAAFGDRAVAASAPGVAATIVAALVPGWWVALAGSAALALLAAFAIVQTLALTRRRELGVLRALGVTSGAQGRERAAELASVLGGAVGLGAAAGVLAAWLIVPGLVRAVTPGILPLGTPVALVWTGLVIAVGGLSLGLAALVAAAASEVRRAAQTATVGEDGR
ncbi:MULTISPECIES: FtsX-like permease family protein [unclassified Microbacterium]|uniref:FtsX-like permease family protein n=1 Tax=unclassified Microbacterium TaxID=2609290 RepID=UPI00214BD227|nr:MULTISPECIES: FtsX-like permease family protein [unclassified Microbacterium]MCR2808567.1 hypothetical protein [Microbacterium sp. zg.B185]WIM18995.1 hypothetical protein QNO12_15650 [Microbacterium sp. zg-B185]